MIGDILKQAAGVSFEDVFSRFQLKYKSARDFRERNLLGLIETLRGASG